MIVKVCAILMTALAVAVVLVLTLGPSVHDEVAASRGRQAAIMGCADGRGPAWIDACTQLHDALSHAAGY